MKLKKKARAKLLNDSLRGQYLISRALCIAVKVLKKQPKHLKEDSTIADMEFLIENIYPIHTVIEKTQELQKDVKQKPNNP